VAGYRHSPIFVRDVLLAARDDELPAMLADVALEAMAERDTWREIAVQAIAALHDAGLEVQKRRETIARLRDELRQARRPDARRAA